MATTPDTFPLRDRHAVVTGGSKGIGAAVAAELAGLGARITLLGRDAARLEQTRGALVRACGQTHSALAVDVTDVVAVARAFERASAELGAPHILVNNAGAAAAAPFLLTDDTTWRHMLDVNLMGAVFCTRAVVPAMAAAGGGRIVNIASTAGLAGYRYVSAYAASKHALVGLTRALALELERDAVTVNAVCPGYTDTDLLAESASAAANRTGRSEEQIRQAYAASNPHGRLLQPAEVARVVAWLCLPAQGNVTGRAIVVDGGHPIEGVETS